MLIKFQPSKSYDRIRAWHWWFAWYPIRLGEGEWLWLETICRVWYEDSRGSAYWKYGNRK